MRVIISVGLLFGLTGCAVIGATSAVVSTTAKVITLPVKAAGAAVDAITPGDDADDETSEDGDDK